MVLHSLVVTTTVNLITHPDDTPSLKKFVYPPDTGDTISNIRYPAKYCVNTEFGFKTSNIHFLVGRNIARLNLNTSLTKESSL